MNKKELLKKSLSIAFVLLSSLLLEGCSITPPSVPICAEINLGKGYCVNTIKNEEYEISDEKPFKGKTWWELRPTMIMVPADSWKEIKSFIIRVCKMTGKCNTNITDWERTVKAIDEKIIK